MGSFNKKYIIREAETILEECNNKLLEKRTDNNLVTNLQVRNKKLKRSNALLKLTSIFLIIIMIVLLILK